MLFYLYRITNIINNKIYTGVSNNIEKRWYTHKNIAKGGKINFPHHFQAIHGAIVKHGENNFIIETIKTFTDEDECYRAESDYIDQLRATNTANYNIAGGGKGTGSGPNHPMFGKKLPVEWVAAISKASKEVNSRPSVKAIRKEQMIERNWVGENHPMFGKSHSKETRAKISEKGKGRIFTEEHKNNLSAKLSNKPKSEEHKKNISLSKMGKHTGINNPNAKLTLKNIEEIKKMLDEGLSSPKIGKLFNVSKTTILRIKKNKLT